MNHEATHNEPRVSGFAARALGVPLFYKILVANAALVLVVTLVATWMATRLIRTDTAFLAILGVALAGAALSIAVNAVIIRLALEPLRLLKDTADAVQEGDLNARVPVSPLADREMRRLTLATNAMLDRLFEYRRRLREVAARALNAAEEERRRIALELHDDASQRLAAVLMRLRLARSIPDADAKDAMLEEIRRELAEAADGLRRYAQGLRPPALDELGLGPAIESHVRHISEASAAPVAVHTEGVGRLESPDAELALYRIVQEAITNALRHSGARRIDVDVERCNGAVVATVRDDGSGFDVFAVMATPERDHGLGLFGMRERAEYVGGRVDVRSEAGQGTVVRAAVPTRGAGAPLSAEALRLLAAPVRLGAGESAAPGSGV
ncbi:MAG: sensor histidine kinase [Gemmatimonadota bacterium]|jgi:two-component system sensor histidine kinase UhpB